MLKNTITFNQKLGNLITIIVVVIRAHKTPPNFIITVMLFRATTTLQPS